MCNEVSITCGNSGLKNAHLQLVHGSTLRLFRLLVPGGCSVTACELLSIMRIYRHGQLLPRRVTVNKVQDLAEWSRKQEQAARGKLPFLCQVFGLNLPRISLGPQNRAPSPQMTESQGRRRELCIVWHLLTCLFGVS